MNEFCTLFDAHYLPRALALYRSLERHCEQFRLWALCMDDQSERLLTSIAADRLELISIRELEEHDPQLRAVRGTRSFVEYCWTCTPCLCRYLLDHEPGLEAITYLDADLMFFASPAPLFAELGARSVLLVPHRWAPEHQQCEVADTTSADAWGTYNVEFMTFRGDADARVALEWWRERCLELCPAMLRPGYFGDQKYLDDWPNRFEGVHVLEHLGGGLAPWNVSQYRLERCADGIVVDGQPLVFHHYQALWLHQLTAFGRSLARWSARYRRCRLPPYWIWSTRWPLAPEVLDLLWDPYVERVADAGMELIAAGAPAGIGTEQLSPAVAAARLVKRHLPKRLRRSYWQVRRAAGRPPPLTPLRPTAGESVIS